ncbi:hypothetical protein VT84_03385 [Gemmata sp. SH-PL17]|uniref:hypothetical protein n=1 Tax=Gemmata sp. SH-PL17 TaxID=1630693 RepID=UPI00078B36F8|nr:hypothetical protein [Gemmata sp. SH-PL17]AMV23426.1 hypothetical protein VT84_03385 [Gemmata sp. SH-PL17]
MAFNANTVWEVRVDGDDSNGGSFNTNALGTGNTDYSQQAAPQIAVTDAVTNASTTITSATANFPANCVGNGICIEGGTGAITRRYVQILSRTSATTVVVDAATGLTTGTGATLKMGGALASPGGAFNSLLVSGNVVFYKYNALPFVITSTTQGATGGRISPTNGVSYSGYDTTRRLRNWDANRPTIQLDASLSTTNIVSSTSYALIESVILDGNNITLGTGCAHRGSTWRCRFQNFTNGGVTDGAATGITEAAFCEFTGNSGAAAAQVYHGIGCVAWNNSATPFQFVASARDCISFGNTGVNTDGFSASRKFWNCIAYGNARNGFNLSSAAESAAYNCISEANLVSGYVGNSALPFVVNCADFGNSSGRSGGNIRDLDPINLSASAFVNAAGGDFRLNATAGAGALLRALALPVTFPGGAGANYRDIGPIQHQDSGGGNSGGPVRILAPNTWHLVG